MLKATREQVTAFRASALHVADRLPSDRLDEAVRPCGLQNTPPGSAAVGAAARFDGLTPDVWKRALEVEKSLVQLWAMRGSPFVVAASDLPLFTVGLRPSNERAALHLITSGLRPAVEESGVSALDLVQRLANRLRETLEGRVVTKSELGRELASAVPSPLRRRLADKEQLSTLTLTVARIVAHEGSFLIAPHAGNAVSLVRTDQWLGRDAVTMPPDDARRELMRRFLHAFGPATASDFAWWSAVHPDARTRRALEEHAESVWKLIEAEVVEVERPDGSRGYVLAADVPRLSSPRPLEGVRLLPPHDPLLMLRDRETLVGEAHHRKIWRHINNPGIVLADGHVVATWNGRKSGRKLILTVESLDSSIEPATREEIREEAIPLGPLRGCTAVELAFAD